MMLKKVYLLTEEMEHSDINNINIAVLMTDIQNIKTALEKLSNTTARIEQKMEDKYATKEEMKNSNQLIQNDIAPLKKIVYGLVSLVLVTFVGALFVLILK